MKWLETIEIYFLWNDCYVSFLCYWSNVRRYANWCVRSVECLIVLCDVLTQIRSSIQITIHSDRQGLRSNTSQHWFMLMRLSSKNLFSTLTLNGYFVRFLFQMHVRILVVETCDVQSFVICMWSSSFTNHF